jgi:hypothetical protein
MFGRRIPYWQRQAFQSETIGVDAAYQEGERERELRIANIPATDVRHQTYLPLVGGPLDGGGFRVPTLMLRGRGGSGPVTIPIPVGPDSKVVVPTGVHKPRQRAIYRLDRTSPPTLRFERVERM